MDLVMRNYLIWNGKTYVRECVSYKFSNFTIHRLCNDEIGEGNGYGYETDMMRHTVKNIDVPKVVHILYKRRVGLKGKVGEIEDNIRAVGMRGFGADRCDFKKT